jgi:hypothetical protein
VAIVSGVMSMWTGSDTTSASARPPLPVAVKLSFAVPSAVAFAGHETTTDSLGETSACRASAPSMRTPSASSATFTVVAAVVELRRRTRSSAPSPTRRKRGSAERIMSGCAATSSFRPSPTIDSPLIARTCMRQVVRLSGSFTSTAATPSSSVTS